MAVMQTIRDALGMGGSGPLPGGMKPDAWVKRSLAERPAGYESAVDTALNYYRGHSQADALATLRKLFPLSADAINLVTLDVLRLVVDEQARVFAGDPTFGLVDASGAPASDETLALWRGVLADAEAQRKLIEVDRLTRAARRYFVRVTWDKKRWRHKLTLFPPHKVFPLYALDCPGDLGEAEGVLLELAPTCDKDGKPVRRWEFWSAGETPENFIVDERGEVTLGENEGEHEYTDEAGNPIVPIVSFSDADEDAGCWLLPSESLVTAQRNLDSTLSNIFHVAKHQGYGQWVFKQVDRNAESWAGEAPPTKRGLLGRAARDSDHGGEATIRMGPETPMRLPSGWDAQHVPQDAPLRELMDNLVAYLKQVAISERIPPSALIADPGQTASGVALAVQRLPLSELRRDRVALFQRPAVDLLEVIRRVWVAHNPKGGLEGFKATFAAGDIVLPTDPVQEAAIRQARIRDGLTSAAREIAREEGISLDEAKARAAEIQAEQRAGRAPITDLAASLRAQAAGVPTP